MRFFIISKGWKTIRGDLFDHCTPKNLSGLYTWQARRRRRSIAESIIPPPIAL
jgi:hypothetical protein